MKNIFTHILVLINTLIFLSVSNGFIIEKYFCSGCKEEHEEVKLFEFGTISHDHPTCTHCEEHGLHCTCFDLDDHLNSSTVEYFSLDDIFFSFPKKLVENIKVLDLLEFGTQAYLYSKIDFISEISKNKVKIPPEFSVQDKNIISSPCFLCTFLL